MPTLPFPFPPVVICELTPITRPLASSSGPPGLPGLIGASVWITESIWNPSGAWMCRPVPETRAAGGGGRPGGGARGPREGGADRDGELARAHRGRVGERQRLQRAGVGGVDLEHREVGGSIDAAHGRGRGPLVGELYLHLARVADDVRVRDERAVRVDDEAGAGSAAGADGDDGG